MKLIKNLRSKFKDMSVDMDDNYEENLELVERYTFESCCDVVKAVIEQLSGENLEDYSLNIDELEKKKQKQMNLNKALNECSYGHLSAKLVVKNYISNILTTTFDINENTINFVIPFNRAKNLSARDKFDILLTIYKKKYKNYALMRLIEDYDLDRLRKIDNNYRYIITKEDIEKIYKELDGILKKLGVKFTFEDKLEILAQRIYSDYRGLAKGLGCIDEIRDQIIDGISGGVSGLPEDFIELSDELEWYLRTGKDAYAKIPRAYDSIWLFFKGKNVHLEFLSFGSFKELERITKVVYKYGSAGQLDKKTGFKVNKMADGSRVVALRPEFSETWMFFIRKFDVPSIELEDLFKGKNIKMAIDLIKYLMKGEQTTAITGEQGTGKTTLLMSMIKYIYRVHTLRLLEMAFELHLRKRYPNFNIATIQELPSISGQAGLDILKKTDGNVSIVGEVATDPVCAYMIQTAQVASRFTIFTHHAKSFSMLIEALRNSLLKQGIFRSEKLAEEQVVEVLDFNIHIKKNNFTGERYIERITECIPYKEDLEYPLEYREKERLEDIIKCSMDTIVTFFKKITDKRTYIQDDIDIVVFDAQKKEYILKNMISEKRIKEMIFNMSEEDAEEFREFLYLCKVKVGAANG